jgi:hypothetical protein
MDAFGTLPKEFKGRDSRNYVIQPKEALIELLNCKYKKVLIAKDKEGKKRHIENYEKLGKEANTWQFFVNLEPHSPLKSEGEEADNRIFKQPQERTYCIDFDVPVEISQLPYFMKENGFYSLSTSGKLHWYFKCCDDIRHLLGNKVIIWNDINGKLENDIDLKDTLYERMTGNIYFPNTTKNMYVSSGVIERMVVGTPVKMEKEAKELKIYEDMELWKALMALSIKENAHYDTWRKMCFLLPNNKEMEDAFVEWSKVGYKHFNEEGCRQHFKSSGHLPNGLPALIKTAKSYNAGEVERLISGMKTSCNKKYIKLTHNSAANLFYKITKDKYIYTATSGWYINRNGSWVNIVENVGLLTEVIDTLKPIYKRISDEIIQKEDDDEKKAKLRKEHAKLLEKIESTGFIKSTIEQLQSMFLMEEVFETNSALLRPTEFNIFTGFNAEKFVTEYNGYADGVREEKCKNFLEHTKLVCGEEAGSNGVKPYEYVLDWIAQLFQQPWRKVGVAVVITGRQGVGKDTIYEFLKHMIGEEYCTSTTRLREEVFTRFNASALRYKLLVNFPEAKCVDTSASMNAFKDMITGSTDRTEHKNMGSISTKSHVRYFLTSNDVNPIKIEQGDRRFCIIQSPAERQDKAYFDKLYKDMADESVIYSLYQYFLSRDISNVNFDERPQSAYLEDLQEYSCPPTISFLQTLFEGNVLDAEKCTSIGKLYSQYENYCRENGVTHPSASNKLSLELNRLGKSLGITKLENKHRYEGKVTSVYEVDLIQLQSGLAKYRINV